MSPIYKKIHSKTGEVTILGDTPDQSGEFELFDGSKISQDFSLVGPHFVEQSFTFKNPQLGSKTIALSKTGEGSYKSCRLKGVFDSYNYKVELHKPIRENGTWRRVREGNRSSGKVIGWAESPKKSSREKA